MDVVRLVLEGGAGETPAIRGVEGGGRLMVGRRETSRGENNVRNNDPEKKVRHT